MVIRAIIHSEARNVRLVEFFDNEQDAINWLNSQLSKYELNEGQTLGSKEDIPAANGVIAEMFNDLYNMQNFIEFGDIEPELIEQIHSSFCEHHWPLDLLMKMANDMGVNTETIPAT